MIDQLIAHFKLKPLYVEGGLFAQTYRSEEQLARAALPERYTDAKPLATAIVFLYTPDANMFSALHRLPTDEIYHFYMGDPVLLLQLHPDGRTEHVILGHDVLNGQRVQHVAPRGVWQGSVMLPGGKYALLGMTTAPGFTHTDYEGGERDVLLANYPHEADLIHQLTRTDAPLTMPPGSGS
jgi:uncharacterized protein